MTSQTRQALNRRMVDCTLNKSIVHDTKIDDDSMVDGKKFVATIRNEIDLRVVKGYSIILQSPNLTNVARDAGGWAITNCDPNGPAKFTHDTRANWGSVSKVITAAAALRAMEQSSGFDLDSLIVDSMPKRWRQHSKFKTVTWAQLLSHQAGLRKSAGTGCYRPSGMRVRFESDFYNDPKVGVRSYSNTLGAAGKLLLPHIAVWPNILFEAQLKDVPLREYDEQHNILASRHYREYVTDNILEPSGVNTATCNMLAIIAAGLPYARGYASADAKHGGHQGDYSLNCPSGGWVMSSREMARFLRTLVHTNKIIDRTSYERMVDPPNAKDVLGFDRPDSGYKGGKAYHKNGSVGNYSAYIAVLPKAYTLVAVSNSGNLSSDDLKRAARAAWNASVSPPNSWTL